MTLKVEARNQHVQYMVSARIEHVKTLTESDFTRIKNRSEIEKILEALIEISVNGFRGVVLTALVGMDAHFCQAFSIDDFEVGKDCSHTSGF
ncbi:MAG: hypothetical protein WDM70_02260 [Nitrosomonadales bacterium]